jgi:hypothetical protein
MVKEKFPAAAQETLMLLLMLYKKICKNICCGSDGKDKKMLGFISPVPYLLQINMKCYGIRLRHRNPCCTMAIQSVC